MQEKEISLELVEESAKQDCTLDELAALARVNISTIRKRLADNPEFREAWERGLALKRVNVRRLMWRHAKGFGPHAVNATIHLAKHILGQTEKSLVEVTGTIQHEVAQQQSADLLTAGVDPRCLTPQENTELADLCSELDEAGSLRALGAEKRRRMMALIDKGSGALNIIDAQFTEVKPQLPAPVEQPKSEEQNARRGKLDSE